LAGGLNLYGYGEGDPINNSDPFGLCPKCRDVTKEEGAQINKAAILSGSWTYSQKMSGGNKNDPSAAVAGDSNIGDCTDLTFCATSNALGGSWGVTYGNKSSTGMFKGGKHVGYRELGSAEDPQVGDVVVLGGHAGLYMRKDADGNPIAWANNGCPTHCSGGYSNGTTGETSFAPGRFGSAATDNPRYFRAQVKP
jgi:hypothetical protein